MYDFHEKKGNLKIGKSDEIITTIQFVCRKIVRNKMVKTWKCFKHIVFSK